MSNTVLVKNSTYYSSSLNEGYTMATVKNRAIFEGDTDLKLNLIEAGVSSKKKLLEIKPHIELGIVTRKYEDEYTDHTVFDLKYNVCRINDLVDKLYYNLPIVTLNINYGGIALNIPNKVEDNILDAQIIYSTVRDEFSNQERIGDIFEIDETMIERSADISIFIEGSTRTIVMNNTDIQTEDATMPSILQLVSEKVTRDINCVTEQTVVIFIEDQEDGFVNQPMIDIDISEQSGSGSGSGSGENTGGDLESLVFTIQQMSFFEFKLVFKEKKVKEIFNLPQGLFFDKDGQRIVGTPIMSGRYSFTLIFDNESILNGIISVPKINREL